MKLPCLAVVVSVVLLAATGAVAADPATPSVVFVGVTVVDVEAGTLLADRAVAVSGDTITDVRDADGYTPPDGATVVPGGGKFLIPGLWDMHVHHVFAWTGLLDLALVNGVTGVRDLHGDAFVLGWRDEIRAGKRLGPRIVASGKYIDAKLNGQPPGRQTADTPEQGRALVRDRKQAGADLIKVYSGLRPDVYRAVIDEAGAQGLHVAGHCPELVSALEASRLGQRSIEHLTGVPQASSRDEAAILAEMAAAFAKGEHGYDMEVASRFVDRAVETVDEEKRAALFAAYKANGTWQVPTLVTQRPLPPPGAPADPRLKYMHPALTQLWPAIQAHDRHAALRVRRTKYATETVRAMHEAGVPLLAGTDSGGGFNVQVYPGFSLADELEALVGCGLRPADALRTATLNPARYLGEEATAGTVAVGKRADLVLLDADPLADIGNVRRISGVMVNGRWLTRADLDAMLAGLAEATARR